MFNFSMQIGPMSLSMIQIVLLMVGLGLWLAVFQLAGKWWNKTIAAIFAVPIVLLFVFIAFFKVAEMWLVQFMAKVARNQFFDTSKKYQTQYVRSFTDHDIMLKRVQSQETKEKIEQKTFSLNADELQKIKEGWLL